MNSYLLYKKLKDKMLVVQPNNFPNKYPHNASNMLPNSLEVSYKKYKTTQSATTSGDKITIYWQNKLYNNVINPILVTIFGR